MRLFLEADEAFDIYTRKHSGLMRQRFYGTASQLVYEHGPFFKDFSDTGKDVFLLHERHFDYTCFDVEVTSRSAFTVQDLKGIAAEKVAYMKEVYGLSSLYCIHRLRNCFVNGTSTTYILGKQGEIKFSLQFFLLKDAWIQNFRSQVPAHILSHPKIAIYPRSLFLLDHFHHHRPLDDLVILHILDRTCQLIRCHKGWYAHINEIPMGEVFLKSCFEEHNVADYLYSDHQVIEDNALLKKLVTESVNFYTTQLVKRIEQFLLPGQGVQLLGNAMQNQIFLHSFQEKYTSSLGGYVMPFKRLYDHEGFKGYPPQDVPVIAYLLHTL